MTVRGWIGEPTDRVRGWEVRGCSSGFLVRHHCFHLPVVQLYFQSTRRQKHFPDLKCIDYVSANNVHRIIGPHVRVSDYLTRLPAFGKLIFEIETGVCETFMIFKNNLLWIGYFTRWMYNRKVLEHLTLVWSRSAFWQSTSCPSPARCRYPRART